MNMISAGRKHACLNLKCKSFSPDKSGLDFVSALNTSYKLLRLSDGALKLSQDRVGPIFGV
jgi:hypothetical protein